MIICPYCERESDPWPHIAKTINLCSPRSFARCIRVLTPEEQRRGSDMRTERIDYLIEVAGDPGMYRATCGGQTSDRLHAERYAEADKDQIPVDAGERIVRVVTREEISYVSAPAPVRGFAELDQ